MLLLLLLCVVLSEQKFSYDKRTQKKQKREVDERVLSEMFGTAFFRFFVCLTLFLILQNKKGTLQYFCCSYSYYAYYSISTIIKEYYHGC